MADNIAASQLEAKKQLAQKTDLAAKKLSENRI